MEKAKLGPIVGVAIELGAIWSILPLTLKRHRFSKYT